MILFALHYSIFSFVACCGGLQIAAWYNHLDGLLFVTNRLIGGLLGVALAVGAFLWFFLSRERNVPDTEDGLGGSLMFALFLAAATFATVFTLGLSSLVNSMRSHQPPDDVDGVEALRTTTFGTALRASFRRGNRS